MSGDLAKAMDLVTKILEAFDAELQRHDAAIKSLTKKTVSLEEEIKRKNSEQKEGAE